MFFYERYSCKKFDSSKRISRENLFLLKESIRMSPSSLNFQPWKIFCLSEDSRRKELVHFAQGNESQILEASHLFIFCAQDKFSKEEKEKRLQLMITRRELNEEREKNYRSFIEKTLPQDHFAWAKNQIYLALGFLMSTASLLKINHCPMEGFQEEGFNKILDLKDYRTVVLCSVGYAKEESKSPKIRLEESDIYF